MEKKLIKLAEEEIQPDAYTRELSELHAEIIRKAVDESAMPLINRATGKYIREEDMTSEQLEDQQALKDQVSGLQLLSDDQMVSQMYDSEMKILAILEQIQKQGYAELMSDAGMVQSMVEEWRLMFHGGEDSALRDFSEMDVHLSRNEIIGRLTPLPEGNNPLARKYNDELEQYMTMATAYSVNYDPISVDRKKGGRFWTAWPDVFNVQYLSDNERADRFSLTDEHGTPITDIFGYSLNNKERANLHVGLTEKIMGGLPGLIKMAAEIAVVTYLTGGSGTYSTIMRGVGSLAEGGALALGVGKNTSRVIGVWSTMVTKEAVNLEGMNQIGGVMTHTERMPVLPFAVGMTTGSMLFRGMGMSFANFSARMVERQGYAGSLWRTADNIIQATPKQVKWAPRYLSEVGVQTFTIKGAETVTALWGYADGSMSELEFQDFWDHAFTAESFAELYGTMLFMGAHSPGGLGRMVERFRFDFDYLTRGKGVAEYNEAARWLGVKKGIKKLTNDTKPEETTWTEEELTAAYAEKIKEIDDATVWDENTQGTKADARTRAALVFQRLRMKGEIDNAWRSMDATQQQYFGPKSFSGRFQNELNKFGTGKADVLTADQMAVAAKQGPEGRDFVIKEIQG